MENQAKFNKLATIVVAVLLILTALGNASLMLIFAAIGLAVFIFTFRKDVTRGITLAATLSIALALGIAFVVLVS
jgi:hypothetical protein